MDLRVDDLTNAMAACICSDGAAAFTVGEEVFTAQFDGSISARMGRASIDSQGFPSIPLFIVGYTTTSDVGGWGETTLDFDFDRAIQPSRLKGTDRETFFPAIQRMHLNILMTTEAMPGVTLRSIASGTLVNPNVDTWPPTPGATYALQRPVDLEDVRYPGKAIVRLIEVSTQIISSSFDPERIDVGGGLVLYPSQEAQWVLSDVSTQTPIRFALRDGGLVTIKVFNKRGRETMTVVDEELAAGEHTISFDFTDLRDEEYYYQIEVDERNRTAPMLLIKR